MEVHTCTICPYKSKLISAIVHHVRLHHSRAPNFYFSCQESPPEAFSCLHCDFTTDLGGVLRGHTVVLHQDKEADEDMEDYVLRSHNCKNCRFQTFSTLVMLKHIVRGCKTVVRVRKRRKCLFSGTKKWHKCGQCPFKTKVKSSLFKHKFDKHRKVIKWFQCDYCPYKSKWRQCLKKHMLSVKHKNDKRKKIKCDDYKPKNYKCDECDRIFVKKFSLDLHRSKVHGNPDRLEWFKCGKCWRHFKSEFYLKNHLCKTFTKGTERKIFKCDTCDQLYLRKASLERHIRESHSDTVKWFECDQCLYKSKRKYGLYVHVVTKHTKDEDAVWYNCEQCWFKSKLKPDLNKHLRTCHDIVDNGTTN